LLLDVHGVVRLLDMGLVRFEDGGDALTGTQQVMGTIDYMSPEQAADTKRADARCDIYSLGCTLYYLMTGKKLYDAKGVVERIMMHRGSPIPSLAKESGKKLPDGLEDLYRKMVAKKPDDRVQSMAEVGAALDRLLGRELGDAVETTVAVVEDAGEESLTNLPTAALAKSAPNTKGDGFGGIDVGESNAAAAGPFTINLDSKTAGKVKAAAGGKPVAKSPAKKAKLDKRLVYAGAGVATIIVVLLVWLLLR
jgi:serine/threonine protein kinase